MERNSQIEDLVVRYWKGELSEVERSEILAWAEEHPKNKEFLKHFDSIEPAAQEALQLKRSRQSIWKKITNEAPELKVRKLFTLSRIITIAAAFIIIFGGYFIYKYQSSSKEIVHTDSANQNQIKHPDILPVNQGAQLTLSDGARFQLDSAGRIVARQGNTVFEKKDSGLLIKGARNNEPVYISVAQTFKGKKLPITLPDGTRVILNAESKLEFPSRFTGDYREVTLLEGEAYFDVAHNASYPFHAKVKGQEIAVTGTKFNVRAYSDELEVKSTLFEGGVKIKASKNKVEFKLEPGYQLVADSVNDNFKLIKSADLEKAGAWRKDIFLFKEASIEEIMRELNRHYDIEVKYATKNSQRFNAEIPSDLSIQTIFRILEATKGVRFKIEGRTITII